MITVSCAPSNTFNWAVSPSGPTAGLVRHILVPQRQENSHAYTERRNAMVLYKAGMNEGPTMTDGHGSK